MDMSSQAALDRRSVQWTARKLDEELRAHWASARDITGIARAMGVEPNQVRARAVRIGLAPRPRSSLKPESGAKIFD